MSAGSPIRPGVVYLVGAGPGDPGLMSVRSIELIAAADVIFYDRLIPPTALAGARSDAELIYVGKSPGDAAMAQERIEELMAARARAGSSVVRLKGGDPFVFGRGGEEAETLTDAGIDFEVVPGVTAGVAAPAYAGIPVTHREDASAVAFITGHEEPDKETEAIDWSALAAFPGTLVFYMGLGRLAAIAERLIASGRDPAEPAAVVERGTQPGQQAVTGSLAQIAQLVDRAGLKPPSIILVGAVARRHERLAWLDHRPLHGKAIVVTRARAQAGATAQRLRALGASVIEMPVIRIEPETETEAVDSALACLASYDLLCLTSPNGVHLLFEALAARGSDARALAGLEVAAIGPGTAAALAEHGIRADVVPPRSIAESLLEVLAERGVAGRRVLIARAAEARATLPDGLRGAGAEVDLLTLYRTVAEAPDDEAVSAAQDADYVTFTSASTVSHFVAAVGEGFPSRARVASIGPVTSARASELGVRVDIESSRHDPDGLIAAIVADARGE